MMFISVIVLGDGDPRDRGHTFVPSLEDSSK